MSREFNPPERVKLNDVQLMLLKLFSRPMAETDLKAIRKMLLDYYDAQLQEEVQKAIKEKKITQKDLDEVLNRQHRTKRKIPTT